MTLPAYLIGGWVFIGTFNLCALEEQGAVYLGEIELTGKLKKAYDDRPAMPCFEISEFQKHVISEMPFVDEINKLYREALAALEKQVPSK